MAATILEENFGSDTAQDKLLSNIAFHSSNAPQT
jgi:hypothetical protein